VRLRELAREAVDDHTLRELNRRALEAFRQLDQAEVMCFDAWMRSLDGGAEPRVKGRRRIPSSSSKEPT